MNNPTQESKPNNEQINSEVTNTNIQNEPKKNLKLVPKSQTKIVTLNKTLDEITDVVSDDNNSRSDSD